MQKKVGGASLAPSTCSAEPIGSAEPPTAQICFIFCWELATWVLSPESRCMALDPFYFTDNGPFNPCAAHVASFHLSKLFSRHFGLITCICIVSPRTSGTTLFITRCLYEILKFSQCRAMLTVFIYYLRTVNKIPPS